VEAGLAKGRDLCQQKPNDMISTSMKANSKEVGNVNVSGRMKQIFVLIIAILIGMIISVTTAEAKDFQRESNKRNKGMYKKQTMVLAHACQKLEQKRNVTTNKVVKDTSKLKFR
jgi:hypothetical protein